jgi:agmatinase
MIGGAIYSIDEADVIFLGLPYACKRAPSLIRNCINKLESYDLEAKLSPWEKFRICDLGDLRFTTFKEMEKATLKKLREIYSRNIKALEIFLGGNHLVTLATTHFFHQIGKDFSLVYLDAHTDLRDDYLGERYSNATVGRRILDFFPSERFIQVGVRSSSLEEQKFLKKIRAIPSWELSEEKLLKALKEIKEVYLSVDIDVLDPSFAPSVEFPEPFGLTPKELLSILKIIFKKTKVFALDLVEVSSKSEDITCYNAAGLISKILSWL